MNHDDAGFWRLNVFWRLSMRGVTTRGLPNESTSRRRSLPLALREHDERKHPVMVLLTDDAARTVFS